MSELLGRSGIASPLPEHPTCAILRHSAVGSQMPWMGPHRVDNWLEPALRHLGSGPFPAWPKKQQDAFGSKRLQLRTYDHD
jgi:hypothetical protein